MGFNYFGKPPEDDDFLLEKEKYTSMYKVFYEKL